MNQPNEQLRQARERTPSRQVPGEPLSRQELAERVNEWVFKHAGKLVELDDNYIGKLERGAIRWPTKLYRDAFHAVLGVEADAQLGFYGRRLKPATVVDVDRQQFLRTAGGVMASPWLELFAPTPTPVPAQVTRMEIEQVRAATTVFSSWDNTYGGGLAREAVFAQLRWSARLLHAHVEILLRPELFAATALLGTVAGFMAFDAYAHDDARHSFRFSLACAEQSGNWHVRARVLTAMARQAIWCGFPDDGLTHIEFALVRSDRLSARERAALHTLRARSLAKLGRVQECLAAVGAADEAFSHGSPTEDPPWMVYYKDAQHHGDAGGALYDLAIHGRRTEAAQRLAYSVAHHGPSYARSRALSRTKLASLLMVTGDPRKAAAVGQAALESAGSLRSKRAADDLRELHRLTGRHPRVIEVIELRERLAETLDSQ